MKILAALVISHHVIGTSYSTRVGYCETKKNTAKQSLPSLFRSVMVGGVTMIVGDVTLIVDDITMVVGDVIMGVTDGQLTQSRISVLNHKTTSDQKVISCVRAFFVTGYCFFWGGGAINVRGGFHKSQKPKA